MAMQLKCHFLWPTRHPGLDYDPFVDLQGLQLRKKTPKKQRQHCLITEFCCCMHVDASRLIDLISEYLLSYLILPFTVEYLFWDLACSGIIKLGKIVCSLPKKIPTPYQ